MPPGFGNSHEVGGDDAGLAVDELHRKGAIFLLAAAVGVEVSILAQELDGVGGLAGDA